MEGCKVGYGFDFVGDDYNGKNTPVPDSEYVIHLMAPSHKVYANGKSPTVPWTVQDTEPTLLVLLQQTITILASSELPKMLPSVLTVSTAAVGMALQLTF